jgi:predicted negative regulator of RcsB-dependent stress response
MKKKRALTILCVVALAACALAFGWRPRPAAQTSPQQQAAEVPIQVMYKHLFHHVSALKKKAEEVEKESKDATQFRTHFIRKANLTPEQSRVLEEVASELEQDEQLIAARGKTGHRGLQSPVSRWAGSAWSNSRAAAGRT